jgi:hypothetical protein
MILEIVIGSLLWVQGPENHDVFKISSQFGPKTMAINWIRHEQKTKAQKMRRLSEFVMNHILKIIMLYEKIKKTC